MKQVKIKTLSSFIICLFFLYQPFFQIVYYIVFGLIKIFVLCFTLVPKIIFSFFLAIFFGEEESTQHCYISGDITVKGTFVPMKYRRRRHTLLVVCCAGRDNGLLRRQRRQYPSSLFLSNSFGVYIIDRYGRIDNKQSVSVLHFLIIDVSSVA